MDILRLRGRRAIVDNRCEWKDTPVTGRTATDRTVRDDRSPGSSDRREVATDRTAMGDKIRGSSDKCDEPTGDKLATADRLSGGSGRTGLWPVLLVLRTQQHALRLRDHHHLQGSQQGTPDHHPMLLGTAAPLRSQTGIGPQCLSRPRSECGLHTQAGALDSTACLSEYTPLLLSEEAGIHAAGYRIA